MRLGYKLFSEAFGPAELVRQARLAEDAGFDFVSISDHYHPWLPDEDHGHSSFAWSVLGAIAQATTRVDLQTGVTCPTFRYHPAIIAQAAATVALLSDGRFTMGVGSGERLNEHIIGEGWPGVPERHARLREAIRVIRQLWEGGNQTFTGEYYRLDAARVYDLPETLPDIAVAAGGPLAAKLAGELGDALVTTEPKSELVDAYRAAGGTGAGWCEVPLAWARDEDAAVRSAHRLFRFGALGWKVMPELQLPANFDAAAQHVTLDTMREQFACGPDVDRHVAVTRQFTDAGFDHLTLINAGPDVDGFFDWFASELRPALQRQLAPA
jgi:G6PDH family F420-dependent oxidoreductase